MIIKNSIDKEIKLVMEDLDGRAETYLSIEPDYNYSQCKVKYEDFSQWGWEEGIFPCTQNDLYWNILDWALSKGLSFDDATNLAMEWTEND